MLTCSRALRLPVVFYISLFSPPGAGRFHSRERALITIWSVVHALLLVYPAASKLRLLHAVMGVMTLVCAGSFAFHILCAL